MILMKKLAEPISSYSAACGPRVLHYLGSSSSVQERARYGRIKYRLLAGLLIHMTTVDGTNKGRYSSTVSQSAASPQSFKVHVPLQHNATRTPANSTLTGATRLLLAEVGKALPKESMHFRGEYYFTDSSDATYCRFYGIPVRTPAQ